MSRSNDLMEDKRSDHTSFTVDKEVYVDNAAVTKTLVGGVAHSIDLTNDNRSDCLTSNTNTRGGSGKSADTKILLDVVAGSIDLTYDKRSILKLSKVRREITTPLYCTSSQWISYDQLQKMKEIGGYSIRTTRRQIILRINQWALYSTVESEYKKVIEFIEHGGDLTLIKPFQKTGNIQSDPDFVQGTLNASSLKRLAPGQWLNDEVIDTYLKVMRIHCNKNIEGNSGERIWTMNTNLLNKLYWDEKKYKFKNVKTWKKNVCSGDIFGADVIFVPVNVRNCHWVLAEIHLKLKVITVYDSLEGNNKDTMELLLMYLSDEHKDTKKIDIDVTAWRFVQPKKEDIPNQTNGIDCGVFVCMNMFLLANGFPLLLDHTDVLLFRKHIAVTLYHHCSEIVEE